MGNSCCVYASNDDLTKPQRLGSMNDVNHSLDELELPHISDREDLSNHKGTLFLERSAKTLEKTENGNVRNRRHTFICASEINGRTTSDSFTLSPVKKSNSCSTIFIDDNTVSQPNLKAMLKCVSLAIYFHVRTQQETYRLLDIFDEQSHPLTKERISETQVKTPPEHRHIYRFLKTLFTAAQLTAECAIITLVYLERLLTYAEIDLHPTNWKRVVLGAVLLASKVWDDQAVWNVDYCQILKDITVEDMNELERSFLEFLQFNINVPSSVYAKYYFDLRALAEEHGLNLPLQPLDKDRARRLEATSRICEAKSEELSAKVLSRSNSLDAVYGKKRRRNYLIVCIETNDTRVFLLKTRYFGAAEHSQRIKTIFHFLRQNCKFSLKHRDQKQYADDSFCWVIKVFQLD